MLFLERVAGLDNRRLTRAPPRARLLAVLKADRPSPDAYLHAAWLLACDPLVLRAIGTVEAGPEGAFLDDGAPVILFERHVFSELTGRLWDGTRAPAMPDRYAVISARSRGGYGPYSAQHTKLDYAINLNREAALKACSWGLFQILGRNHAQAGYPDLQRFITAMYRSVDDHLRALVMYIRHDSRLVDAIRSKDWQRFAAIYNGPAFKDNRYDEKMADAYVDLSRA